MKRFTLLLLVASLNVSAAGLANLLNPTSTAKPEAPKPAPTKSPVTTPAIQSTTTKAAASKPAPADTPKTTPVTKTESTTQEKSSTDEKTKEGKNCTSPTDATCKK